MSKTIMQTYSGGPFDILNPRPEDVRLLDIAEHLSKINRFTGATRFPVSVAQHSIIVSMLLEGTGFELAGLMHDAHEAYINDIGRPMKHAILALLPRDVPDPIAVIGNRVLDVIAKRFNVALGYSEAVHRADNEALEIERRGSMNPASGVSWATWELPEPRPLSLAFATPEQARDSFIARFTYLDGLRRQELRGRTVH